MRLIEIFDSPKHTAIDFSEDRKGPLEIGERGELLLASCQALPLPAGLAIAAVIGTGLKGLIIALCITAIPSIARIARGAAQQVMQQEYMEAGRAAGSSDLKLIWRYLAANCWPVIMIYMTLQLGQVILLGSALSFLGLGAQPPTAELGSMAADGRRFLTIAPHVSTLPCVAIFMVVLAFNVLGDALRDALDPQLRQ